MSLQKAHWIAFLVTGCVNRASDMAVATGGPADLLCCVLRRSAFSWASICSRRQSRKVLTVQGSVVPLASSSPVIVSLASLDMIIEMKTC